jgi:hypothetical protein
LAAIGDIWQGGGAARDRRGFQGNPKPDPNLAKSGKIQPRPSKENQRKKLGFPGILLSGSSLFKGLR